jgi:hypothetical protein
MLKSIHIPNSIRTRDSNVRVVHRMVTLYLLTERHIGMEILAIKVPVRCEPDGLTCV